ncbi:Hypothetical_protein [Hexamita inflata]|uniref:Hypothetical_protein n=1 Tax=Hexamita inflata TaxID=28002 RepID=A0AA86Q3M8_9EUKA|nr:Hypothetical protein HINF_LOCUS36728 [Hexamita inflata]
MQSQQYYELTYTLKYAAKRIGINFLDLIPVCFDDLLELYSDFDIAFIYYEAYAKQQLILYEQIEEQLNDMFLNGLKSYEVKDDPRMMSHVLDTTQYPRNSLPQFLEYLKTQYREADKIASSVVQLQQQVRQEWENLKIQQKRNQRANISSAKVYQKLSNSEKRMKEKKFQEQQKEAELRRQKEQNKIVNKAKQKSLDIERKKQSMEAKVEELISKKALKEQFVPVVKQRIHDTFDEDTFAIRVGASISYTNPITFAHAIEDKHKKYLTEEEKRKIKVELKHQRENYENYAEKATKFKQKQINMQQYQLEQTRAKSQYIQERNQIIQYRTCQAKKFIQQSESFMSEQVDRPVYTSFVKLETIKSSQSYNLTSSPILKEQKRSQFNQLPKTSFQILTKKILDQKNQLLEKEQKQVNEIKKQIQEINQQKDILNTQFTSNKLEGHIQSRISYLIEKEE